MDHLKSLREAVSMIRNPMRITCTILFVLTAVTAGAQTPASSPAVNASINASKTGTAISPYVYGQFVEHAGTLVYSGLWSEMLDDRKFYNTVASALEQAAEVGSRADVRERAFHERAVERDSV